MLTEFICGLQKQMITAKKTEFLSLQELCFLLFKRL